MPTQPTRRAMLVWTATLAACRVGLPRAPTRVTEAGEVLETEDGPLPIGADDPQRGPRAAPVVLVVFSDFQCPFCRDVAESLDRLAAAREAKLWVVFKHLPLPMHPRARVAALAAQCVFLERGSDAFWRFHDRCFAHGHALDDDQLSRWATEEGVSAEALARRVPAAEATLRRHGELAARLGVGGTPRLYINRRRVAGAYPREQLEAWIDAEL